MGGAVTVAFARDQRLVPLAFSSHTKALNVQTIDLRMNSNKASMWNRLYWQLTTSPLAPGLHIPGNFIPAILRAKLGLPICLNIFFICAYWRSRLFTSCTVVPEPREMRLRRLPLITS